MVSERQECIAVMRQFELQMPKCPLRILERLTNFRYRMLEQERNVEMLATSFDFYEHRLNLAKHGFSLIIAQQQHFCQEMKGEAGVCQKTRQVFVERLLTHEETVASKWYHCLLAVRRLAKPIERDG